MCRNLMACFTSALTEGPGQVKSTRNGKQMKSPLEYNWSNLFPITWSICEWMSLCNKRTLSIFKCLIYNLLVGNEAHFLKMSIFYMFYFPISCKYHWLAILTLTTLDRGKTFIVMQCTLVWVWINKSFTNNTWAALWYSLFFSISVKKILIH